jgi:uncharacterized membrane protein YfcA
VSLRQQVLLALLDLTAGFLSSFLGIGGGLVIAPALTVAFHYSIKRVVEPSLAAIEFISLVSVLAELIVKGSNIHWAASRRDGEAEAPNELA